VATNVRRRGVFGKEGSGLAVITSKTKKELFQLSREAPKKKDLYLDS